MLKDDKNEEFKDQIYYAMGDIAYQEGEQDQAIDFLKNSLANNVGNKAQKAESYYKLANIFFVKEDYVPAKKYYDSTLLVMNPSDERFEEASAYAGNLQEIAMHLETVTLQDSLLRIRSMSDEEKRELAQILKKRKLDKQAALASATPNALSNRRPTTAPRSVGSQANNFKSDFFAYDQGATKKGIRDFQKVWGDRPLVDDWRRNSESIIADGGSDNEGFSKGFGITVSESEMDDFFKDVPKTDKQVEDANTKIMNSLYALGGLFRDRLDNRKKAIWAYEELLRRYPGNEFEVEAMYGLYALYSDDNMANKYADLITSKYPNTTFAKAIEDPNFLVSNEKSDQEIDNFYKQAFSLYETGSYVEALQKVEESEERFGDENTLRPRFALLGALCVGGTAGVEEYKRALLEVTRDFPDTPESIKAREMLKLLGTQVKGEDQPEKTGTVADRKNDATLYKPTEKGLHYVLFSIPENSKLTEVKADASDFNRSNHGSKGLSVSTLMLDLQTAMIVVRRFASRGLAEEYLNSVNADKDEVLQGLDFVPVSISQENYKTLLRSKDLEAYLKFYSESEE